MINITKQGNNVIVTSDNPNSFNISNGELSVPLNTIYYVLDDESDFIQFNSTEEGNILFNGTIGQIQVNGNIVTRDNILMELDNVFNFAAIAGEGGTAGVLSINGYDGYINLKSINGQSLIGSGDITIEGGSVEETDPIFTEWKNSMNVSLGQDSSSEEASISIGSKAVSVGQSIAIGRNTKNTDVDQVAIGYGIKNDDTYYTNINNVLKGDANKYAYIKDNNGNYTKILDLINNGGGSGEETDPIFTEWKNGNSIALGNAVKANGEYTVAIGASSIYDEGTEDEEIFPTEANGLGSIAIGNETIANNTSLAIGSYNNIDNASVALGMGNTITSENSLVIGNNNSLNDGSFKFAYGFFNEPKNNQEINIGTLCKSRTGNTDAERTHFVISSYNNSNGEDNTSCFEIRNDDSIYIKKDNEMVKLQDMLNKTWYGTQSQYDAISNKDNNTTYYILED